jgi:hypothetical protein
MLPSTYTHVTDASDASIDGRTSFRRRQLAMLNSGLSAAPCILMLSPEAFVPNITGELWPNHSRGYGFELRPGNAVPPVLFLDRMNDLRISAARVFLLWPR